ncbi:NAD-glutamate dehydrogenase domain-containing protein [Candidatus Zixiibacteriota bacterium]
MRTLAEIAEQSVLAESQLELIESIILQHGHFNEEAVREIIDWFSAGLGLPDHYYLTTPLENIASHIEAVKAAEIVASLQEGRELNIDLRTERENGATYLIDDHHQTATDVERRIEQRYPNCRLQSYRTTGSRPDQVPLRMYIVEKPEFTQSLTCNEDTDIKQVASTGFLEKTVEETYRRYQRILNASCTWESPLIEVSYPDNTEELRIMVSINQDSGSRFFSNISDVFDSHGLFSNRKYIEQFANGRTIYALYLDRILDDTLIENLVEDISLVYVIPDSPLSPLFRAGELNAQEMVFGYAACDFAHQFMREYDNEYVTLVGALENEPEMVGILRNLRSRLASVSFDQDRIWDSFVQNHEALKIAFTCFDRKFNPGRRDHDVPTCVEELERALNDLIDRELDRTIFRAVHLFIESVLKTNFYQQEKTSLSFLLDPGFLNPIDYPEKPYAIILVLGSEFRGFHIRFRDIARGGVRLVRSPNRIMHEKNSDSLFDENYNLAHTQQQKNKDIPEGGSKGTILLHWRFPDSAESAFRKYIDGLLDLILPGRGAIDYFGEEMLLFLGPDEGTADEMDWASERARQRDYSHWKAFTTGRPVSMGGIPHDIYGMTTNSVHEYVLQILSRQGVDEKQITKVMTGGPDGDLGSNEILISKDRILAIVDGSGVLHDPLGLDRKELRRLAKKRVPVREFDRSLLSGDGFLITVEEKNIKLPGGTLISSGIDLRNTFHLRPEFSADLFVPCGGRPASININNWTDVLDDRGKPRFRFIVEGANLFITEEARLRLEEKGVILYKDAATNKGGVTSSSLEVLADLALTDDEYSKHMCVRGNGIPPFRKQYIADILETIRTNARLEFELIWREHENDGTPRSILTDLLSQKINTITDAVAGTDLWKKKGLFERVLKATCPEVLLQLVPIRELSKRVPDAYLRALFAARLASRYVYMNGLDANEMDFYEFISDPGLWTRSE